MHFLGGLQMEEGREMVERRVSDWLVYEKNGMRSF